MKNKKTKAYNVGVICYNTNDFLKWKDDNDLIGDGLELRNKIKIKNKTYYCISKLNDFCSKTFNKIIETDKAKENSEYPTIISFIKDNVISYKPKNNKINLPSDIKMDKKILKIIDKNLVCGTKKTNTEGIICNKFQTSVEIINYIKKITGNKYK